MHQIRQALRGDAVILLGKNTMIRRAIRGFLNEFPDYERLLPYVKGNVGFVFTNQDLKDIREKITANRVAAPARAGAVAPLDVFVPAINTGLDPSKTSFFQGTSLKTSPWGPLRPDTDCAFYLDSPRCSNQDCSWYH